jgi:2-oxoglutarate/2-oxoacid ferredoxin oxidoreductase subunit beta
MSDKAVTKVRLPAPKLSPFAYPGCPGCQYWTLGRAIAEVLTELNIYDKSIGAIGVGCHGSVSSVLDIDRVLSAHGRAPDCATAIKRLRKDAIVWTIQGDGDCISIGAGAFIGALTRGELLTTIMCNNSNYGTTGGQLSPTTLTGQVTTTSPGGRGANHDGFPTHAAEVAAQFKGVAYSARGAINSPANFQRTKKYLKTAFKKQVDGVGFSFVEVICPCPPNWHLSPIESLKRIEEKIIPEFPLGEFKNVEQI